MPKAHFAFVQAAWENENTAPPDSWPDKGRIQLDNYSVRYREGLDLVLKDISADISGGERV